MVSFMCRKAAWAELTAKVTLVEVIRGFSARFVYFMCMKASGSTVVQRYMDILTWALL